MAGVSLVQTAYPQDATEQQPPLSPRLGEVLDVVEQVFLRDGLKPVRIGPLAAEARCSRRTLYELAASKEALFLLVLDRIMRRTARQGREAIDQEQDPVKRIIAMGTTAAEGLGALTPPFRQAVQSHPPAKTLFDNHVTAARTTLETLIQDAIDQQRFRPISPSIAADAVLALVQHFTDVEHAQSNNRTLTDALTLVFDVFITGAEPRF